MVRNYDGMGRQTSTVTNGVTVTSTFNAYGKPLTQSTPYASGETPYYTTTTYDALGRPDLVTAPDGTQTDYIYNGLTTSVTDAKNRTHTTVTDILGRTLSVTPPTGPAVTFTYDPLGNMLTATRGGATMTLTYDNAGRKKTMNDPDMGFWQYSYNALGGVTSQTDARGCVTNITYDALNRPTGKTYSNCPSTPSVTYTYDAGTNGKGRRTSMTDGSGSTTWYYDPRGRVWKEIKIISGTSFVTEWTYNLADLPVTMTYPDGEVVTFEYNNNMQLTKVFNDMGTPGNLSDDINYAKSIGYDSAGRITTRVLGNDKVTNALTYYAWNAANGAGRLQSAVYTNSTTTLQNFAYSYDTVGNILSISDSMTGETQTFGYDALDRLTSAHAANGPGDYSENYAYNATTGNLETKGDLTLQYLDSNHKHAVTQASNQSSVNSYQYDQNGNQTTRVIGSDTYALSYDAENRLIEVRKNSAIIAQFTFDGDGKRVKSAIGSETIYFVGGHYEKQGSAVTKYYFAGSQRVAVRKNGTLSFILSDHLGSTSVTTDANGIKTSETRYKAWGEVRYTDGVVPTKYSFTGQYSNVEDFGLLFYNARWLDPVTGRFAQADTIVPPGMQGLDRYAYVNNSPVRFVDPSGHFTSEEIEEYLRATYGEYWESYLEAWKSDAVFWNMLLAAKLWDVLAAPTTDLPQGSFEACDGQPFCFDANGVGLESYQGNGPYVLIRQGLPVDTDPYRGENYDYRGSRIRMSFTTILFGGGPAWSQPQYDYSNGYPVATGKIRTVYYEPDKWNPDIFGQSSIPYPVEALSGWSATLNRITGVISLMQYVNGSLLGWEAALTVSYSSIPSAEFPADFGPFPVRDPFFSH